MSRNYVKPHKADKENSRALKRAEKAERLAIRRAAKAIEDQQHPSLWELDRVDPAAHGVARTLSSGRASPSLGQR